MSVRIGRLGGGVALLLIVATSTVGFRGSESRGTSPTRTPGQLVFARECSGCHTMAAKAPLRLSGGSLRGYRMTAREIASFVRVMPVRTPLTPREVVAVSRYVEKQEHATG